MSLVAISHSGAIQVRNTTVPLRDDLERAIRSAVVAGISTSFLVREDELHVRFGRYGLRHVTLRPSKHDGIFLAELCGYAGA